jgi:hypothetical protein
MRKHLCLLVMLSAFYLSGFNQSQTRTATYLNNLNQFQAVYGDQNFPRARAQDVGLDDNIFTCSGKMPGIKDSASSFRSSSVSTLALQGFGFTIPENATISNITVRVKRFKKGTPPVGDQILSLMQRFEATATQPSRYGVFWTYQDIDYPGKIYPAGETEYSFTQNGRGNNGGFFHTNAYEWTPAIVNAVFFGVTIASYPPIGKGSVQACYDLVDITINYTLPPSAPGKSSVATEIMSLKQPSVYPNPFTSKTNLQFTATENGNVIVEAIQYYRCKSSHFIFR